MRQVLLGLALWCVTQGGALADEGDQTPLEAAPRHADTTAITIATRQAPPFAFKDASGEWTGIAIELWKQIAARNGLDFHYRELGLSEMLEAVSEGRVDGAVAALTITSEREQRLDFSHPFHTSGLAIAVPHRGTNPLASLARLFSPAFLAVVAALLGLLIVVGVLIWLAERRTNTQFRHEPLSGIGSGLWWSAVTMTTVGYGDKAPTTLLGRAIAMLWMFAGLILISTFTAAITTTLTVSELDASIDAVDDLHLKRILALEGSTSDVFLADQDIRHRTVGTLSEALDQLAAGDADAVVHDAPILRYRIAAEFPQQLRVLPLELRRQAYGIALPPGSAMRESVNIALIEIIRSKDWNVVLDAYLGTD
ncbi:MAG: transporter substrate-binding domain-containing protein [Gammaproteobacteria bacterium]|jgi:ABC-type amino acid transport substrate-binding protein|nr:transporter substrate-binding domain-containing protein [Gammaproteobacteria bacterium]